MATVVKTWVFAADAEGLTDQGVAAGLAAAWSSTDGNPAGSLSFIWSGSSTGITVTERARRPSTGQTWETWGVPAGATVTSVQITAWDYLCWAAATHSAQRKRIRIVDSGGATVHSAGELVDDTTIRGPDGGVPHAGPAGTSRAVDSGDQASTTDVRIEFELGFTTPSGTDCDFDFDNVQLTITYDPAPPPTIYDYSNFPKPYLRTVLA